MSKLNETPVFPLEKNVQWFFFRMSIFDSLDKYPTNMSQEEKIKFTENIVEKAKSTHESINKLHEQKMTNVFDNDQVNMV